MIVSKSCFVDIRLASFRFLVTFRLISSAPPRPRCPLKSTLLPQSLPSSSGPHREQTRAAHKSRSNANSMASITSIAAAARSAPCLPFTEPRAERQSDKGKSGRRDPDDEFGEFRRNRHDSAPAAQLEPERLPADEAGGHVHKGAPERQPMLWPFVV